LDHAFLPALAVEGDRYRRMDMSTDGTGLQIPDATSQRIDWATIDEGIRVGGLRISSATSQRIDWTAIDDAIGVALKDIKVGPGGPQGEQPGGGAGAVDSEVAARAFSLVLSKLTGGLGWVKSALQVANFVALGSIALTFAGVWVSHYDPRPGGLLSVAGIISLVMVMRKSWFTARDKATLELLPARYTLGLKVCSTPQQYHEVLEGLLRDMETLRKTVI